MATLVTPERKLIYTEGAQFRSAVSEELIQRQGAVTNFISLYQYSEKQFFLNGPYGGFSVPFAFDGKTFFQFNAEIIDCWMFVNETTTATGRTVIDVEYSTTGAVWTSIFSTTPKITNAAGSNVFISKDSTGPNITAPSLAVVNMDAGVALRAKIIETPSASPAIGAGCGIVIHYRPR